MHPTYLIIHLKGLLHALLKHNINTNHLFYVDYVGTSESSKLIMRGCVYNVMCQYSLVF